VRHDHTDPGTSATAREGWNPELQRAQTEDGEHELPDRELTDRELRNRELRDPELRDPALRDPALRDPAGVDVRMADGRAGDPIAADRRMTTAGAPTGARPDGVAGSWQDIKGRFVDDPQGALEAAEALVRTAVDDKVRALNAELESLCARDRGEDASATETLRTRLLRYQAYCERLAGATAQ